MFQRKKNGGAAANLLTIAGEYARLEGSFEIADSLEVECEIGGELDVRGRLTIGKNGVVKADVHTVDAVIRGVYEGNLVASGNVQIAATGRATGNITTDSLVISQGGFFNGSVSRMDGKDGKEDRMYLIDEEQEAPRPAARKGPESA